MKWIKDAAIVYLPVWAATGTRTARYVVLGAPDDEELTLSIERTDIADKHPFRFTLNLYHQNGEPLLRLDFGKPHRNPDGEHLDCPHLHRYREGEGLAWAEPWKGHPLTRGDDLRAITLAFFKIAGISGEVEGGLL